MHVAHYLFSNLFILYVLSYSTNMYDKQRGMSVNISAGVRCTAIIIFAKALALIFS